VYPVSRAHEAARRLRAGDATGKIVISFADAHTGPAPAPGTVANMFGSIAQIGYVVRDIHASMENFTRAGIGPWFHLKGVRPGDFTYQGKPSDLVMDVAVANSGDIQIELITPVNDAPSMYRDFLAAGNEGVQHIAYWSENYQDLYDRALAAGFTVGQEGRIGGADGRFAYLQTEHHPGTVIEISDAGGSKKVVFDLIRLAAANWDGTNPIQEIDAGLIGGDPAAMTAMMEAFG
ncbi:VOC family protein, partial [Streptomyces sp. NPDC059627]